MGELTRCNYCTLAGMIERAKERHVEIVVKKEIDGDMADWTSARYSDEEEPSAWFLELTDHCVC